MDPIIIHVAEVEEGEVAMCYARGEAEALKMKVKVLVAQSCPTLCDPMSCNPPGSSVPGILQARILEWVAVLFSRKSSQPRG